MCGKWVSMDKNKNFNRLFSQYFNIAEVFLFAKGRVGLYVILKALGIEAGDSVAIPGFTCIVVPNAIRALGAVPVFYDIDSSSYNGSPKYLEALSVEQPKALIIQHTYGIPCAAERLTQWADQRGIPVIEDCCHAFGSKLSGQLCGTFGKAAFFSGQWNKPFSTGLGGMLVVNDEQLAHNVGNLLEKEMVFPSSLYNARVALQLKIHDLLVIPRTNAIITRLYRLLSSIGFSIGSSSPCELKGEIPHNYFMGMSPAQMKRGVREMGRVNDNIAHRKKLVKFYEQELPIAGFSTIQLQEEEDPVFVRYPVRVQNKNEILSAALHKGFEIGSWFESPLHPEKKDLERFGYQLGSCPEAEKAAREVINLPTYRKTTIEEARLVIEFLQKYANPIEYY